MLTDHNKTNQLTEIMFTTTFRDFSDCATGISRQYTFIQECRTVNLAAPSHTSDCYKIIFDIAENSTKENIVLPFLAFLLEKRHHAGELTILNTFSSK